MIARRRFNRNTIRAPRNATRRYRTDTSRRTFQHLFRRVFHFFHNFFHNFLQFKDFLQLQHLSQHLLYRKLPSLSLRNFRNGFATVMTRAMYVLGIDRAGRVCSTGLTFNTSGGSEVLPECNPDATFNVRGVSYGS